MTEEKNTSTSKVPESPFKSIDEISEKPIKAEELLTVSDHKGHSIQFLADVSDDHDDDHDVENIKENGELDMEDVEDVAEIKPMTTIDIEGSADDDLKQSDEAKELPSDDTDSTTVEKQCQESKEGVKTNDKEKAMTEKIQNEDNLNTQTDRQEKNIDKADNLPEPEKMNVIKPTNFFKKTITVYNLSCMAWLYRPEVNGNIAPQKQKAWERRRVVLAGTKLLHYELTAKDVAESMGAFAGGTQVSPRVPGTHHENECFGASGMLNLLKTGSRVTPVTAFNSKIESEIVGPTPYGVELKVGEYEWKICFDSVDIHAEWTAALIDIVERLKYLAVRKRQLEEIQKNGQSEIKLEEKGSFLSYLFDWSGNSDEEMQTP